MQYSFTIKGKLPNQNDFISANRANFYVGNKMKRDAQGIVSAAIMEQLKGVRIDDPVMITYKYYEPNRRRDKDNVHAFACKVVQDALVKCGVLKNDGWRNVFGFEALFDCDAENPRIEVTITVFKEVGL